MAVYNLPVGDDPDQTTTFTLGTTRYDFRVRYNQRASNESSTPTPYDGWKLYIALSGQDPFIETPLKTSRDLLAQHRYKPNCPVGILNLVDSTALLATLEPSYDYSPERVNYEELGSRFQLIYLDDT